MQRASLVRVRNQRPKRQWVQRFDDYTLWAFNTQAPLRTTLPSVSGEQLRNHIG
jgi:hypothetical protein